MEIDREVLPVAAFTSLYIIVATAVALGRGNQEFLLYVVVMVLLMLVVWLVHRSVTLNQPVLWALSLWGLAHMAGGLLPVPASWPIDGGIRVLYSLWLVPDRLKYDQVVHAYGFGVATWVCWQGIRSAIRRRGGEAHPSLGLMVLAATGGMGLGAMNEMIEFAVTMLVPETNVGGYINTGWDLVANFVGATTAAFVIGIRGV